MAVLKTLRSLIRNPIPNPNPRFRFCSDGPSPIAPIVGAPPLPHILSSPALAVTPNPLSFILRLTSSHPAAISSPIRRWTPFSGPLFLSSPAWKLSQSATPLYLRGREAAVFPNDLLRARRYPAELGIGRGVEDVIGSVRGRLRRDREPPAAVGAGDEFLNLPNMVSIGRMVSGPFIGWMIMNDWYLPAFCGLIISGATDWLDGFLARKMNINSVFGSYLDPLADKVLIGSVALAMVERDLLHPGLVGLIVFRDVALVGGAVYKRAASLRWEWKSWSNFINLDASNREKVEPLFISKVNTVFQLLLVAAALLQPEFGNEDTQQYVTYLSWLVASTTVASAVGYGTQHFHGRIFRKLTV